MMHFACLSVLFCCCCCCCFACLPALFCCCFLFCPLACLPARLPACLPVNLVITVRSTARLKRATEANKTVAVRNRSRSDTSVIICGRGLFAYFCLLLFGFVTIYLLALLTFVSFLFAYNSLFIYFTVCCYLFLLVVVYYHGLSVWLILFDLLLFISSLTFVCFRQLFCSFYLFCKYNHTQIYTFSYAHMHTHRSCLIGVGRRARSWAGVRSRDVCAVFPCRLSFAICRVVSCRAVPFLPVPCHTKPDPFPNTKP